MHPLSREMRRSLRRAKGRRLWEHKWQDPDEDFGWRLDDVADEVRCAFDAGWLRNGMSVLDLGCGSGESAAWLARQGCDVAAVDVSATAIKRAVEAHGGIRNLSFDVVDVTKRGALRGRQFDALIDRGCLHVVPDDLKPAYVQNVLTWTRPGSTMLLMMQTRGRHTTAARARQVNGLFVPPFCVTETRSNMPLGEREGHALEGVLFQLVRETI